MNHTEISNKLEVKQKSCILGLQPASKEERTSCSLLNNCQCIRRGICSLKKKVSHFLSTYLVLSFCYSGMKVLCEKMENSMKVVLMWSVRPLQRDTQIQTL